MVEEDPLPEEMKSPGDEGEESELKIEGEGKMEEGEKEEPEKEERNPV